MGAIQNAINKGIGSVALTSTLIADKANEYMSDEARLDRMIKKSVNQENIELKKNMPNSNEALDYMKKKRFAQGQEYKEFFNKLTPEDKVREMHYLKETGGDIFNTPAVNRAFESKIQQQQKQAELNRNARAEVEKQRKVESKKRHSRTDLARKLSTTTDKLGKFSDYLGGK